MRTLILLRGAPGCGKSTWIQKNGLKDYTLSPDDIRLLCASPSLNADGNYEISQSNDHLVWKTLFDILELRMQNGELTVIDATNSKTSEIKRYKKLCEEYRYRIFLVDFTDIPIETAKKRNAEREMLKRVPEEVIDKMYARFETQGVPTGVTVIKPDQLALARWHKSDFSGYKKIHHIGDVHGCSTVLRKYFDDNGGIKDDEMYIFVGDYVDRGLENVEILKFLLDIYTKPNVILLEGNHERALWNWANDRVVESKEFELVTKTQLEIAGIDKKEVRKLARKFMQCAYYTYGDKTVLVTHGGVSAIPYNLTDLSARQMIKGTGTYADCGRIAHAFTENTTEDCWQIHGHRNTKGLHVLVDGSTRTFNLEGGVEFGGSLRCVQLDKTGAFTIHEIKNEVFRSMENRTLSEEQETTADAIMKMRNNKHIKETRLGNISSFNFTRSAFYEEVWNNQTMRARGLFINVPEAKVVARSYNKFFNVNEREETRLDVLQHSLKFPLTAYVKENGFLGIISYNEETDDFFIASKSTTESPYAGYLREMFMKKTSEESRRKTKEYMKSNNVSFVFECVDMENDPHVIEYPESKLVLLDIIHNDLGFRKYSYLNLMNTACELGFSCKELAAEFDSWQEFYDWYKLVMDEDYELDGKKIEGFVVEDAVGYMFKLKLTYYHFWKFMRSIAAETVRKGHIDPRRTADLTTPLANHFYSWIKSVRENTETPETIPESICILRKMFYESDEGKPFAERM